MKKPKVVRDIEQMLDIKNVVLAICPTPFDDYDILVIGRLTLLKQLYKKLNKEYASLHLIKESKFGCSLIVLDTCDTLRDANKLLTQWRKVI